MDDIACKLLVIGAGPGGYVCAVRAGQLGLDTVIVEANKPGGTCLNVGCIPSKALIHAANEFHKLNEFCKGSPLGISAQNPAINLEETMAWKDAIVGRLNVGVSGLLRRANVKLVLGRARFIDGKTVEVETDVGRQRIRTEAVVIATGSTPVELPSLPFGGRVISSTEALSLESVPARLVVVGAGYIGLEIGTAFAKLGAEVTLVEMGPRILPRYDAELTQTLANRLEDLGVTIHTGAFAHALSKSGKKLLVETEAGTKLSLSADCVLVTVGRRPMTDGFGLEELQLQMDGAKIHIDEACRTSMREVYAIGDVTGEPMLAHRAMAQGQMVAEIIGGSRHAWEKQVIPAICFTDPEVVLAGLSPGEASESRIEVKTGVFPFRANGKAMTEAREDGFIRVVTRSDNNVVVGVQAVGPGVAELSSVFSLAIEMGARLEDLSETIHAHPTRSEALQEAALVSLGHALHI